MQKIENGVFYTIKNCFINKELIKWINNIPNLENRYFIEPFCGSNNIIKMIRDVKFNNKWKAFDINTPETNVCEDIKIEINDSINNYTGNINDVVITNPPYLAKNSATRKKLKYPDTEFDDLYKLALSIMLEHHDFVIAIIPESFITANLFQNRIDLIISINERIFNDTNVPCCIACFSPQKNNINFNVFSGEKFLLNINNQTISVHRSKKQLDNKIIFNDINGQIGCICIDGTKKESIRFVNKNEIKDSEIKVSSRAKTRIFIDKLSGLNQIEIDLFITGLNLELKKYRDETKDVFLTSFKGLRADNRYRRRIDFKTLRTIINKELVKLN